MTDFFKFTGAERIKVLVLEKHYLDSDKGVYSITPDCEWVNVSKNLPITALIKVNRNGHITVIKFDI